LKEQHGNHSALWVDISFEMVESSLYFVSASKLNISAKMYTIMPKISNNQNKRDLSTS
jgi:hypothetical protein